MININSLKNFRIYNFFSVIAFISALFVAIAFSAIIWDIVSHGISKINWSFFTEAPRNAGRDGGVFPVLVSTVLLLIVSMSIAFPVGLATAVWLTEYAGRNEKLRSRINLLLDVLAGIPSIIFGLFGYAFFCRYLGLGFSIWSGGLTLACMMLPILIRTAEIGLSAVPTDWRMAGSALNVSKFAVFLHVSLPFAAPAITAGFLLSIGRATAETAALIYTSGYVDRIPSSLGNSGRSLSVHIYDLTMNVSGGDSAAYGTALVLITLITLINVISNIISQVWLEKRINHKS